MSEVAGQPARILIVDDAPENLNVLMEGLDDSGLSVSVALSGEKALELAQKFDFDAILLDVVMPGIDGFETCRQLKQSRSTKQIPVLFLTAQTDTIDKVKGFEVGGVDYITKPLVLPEVVARLKTHLKLAQRLDQLNHQKLRSETTHDTSQEQEMRRRKSRVFENKQSMEDMVGTALGPWSLKEVLGSGGMGAVFRAENAAGQVVALKTILPTKQNLELHLPRFEQEMRVTRSLSHPGIVGFIDFNHEPVPHLALEYIDGHTLKEAIRSNRRLSERRSLEIALKLSEALAAAHEQGVIHRDLKPENVLLAKDGRVVLADFGLGREGQEGERLTVTGSTMGTAKYTAPEQINDPKSVSESADIYAFGAILFHMLAGRAPFTGPRVKVLAGQVGKAPPLLRSLVPELLPELETLIHSMLNKDPSERPTLPEIQRQLMGLAQTLEDSVQSSPEDSSKPCEEVNGWRLREKIGAGGGSVVYRVEKGKREAALKLLLPGAGARAVHFEREAKILNELSHPNIIELYESGLTTIEGQSCHFMILELMEKDLAQSLREGEALDPTLAAWVTLHIGRALLAVHEAGFVHRDIKAENILLPPGALGNSAVKLSDFGIAESMGTYTNPSHVVGSPHTMAPEQALGGRVEGRSDVYSLAATLFQLLTGRTMFLGGTRDAQMLAHASNPAPRAAELDPSIPVDLSRILERGVVKDVRERPDMKEWIADIEAWCNGEFIEEAASDSQGWPQKTSQSYRSFKTSHLFLIMVLLLILMGLLIVLQPNS